MTAALGKPAPDHIERLQSLGLSAARSGRPDLAIVHFDRAVAARPDDARLRSNLGNALSAARRFDAAVEQYRAALLLAPDFAEAHGNLGNALKGLDRLAESVDCYRRALRLNPDLAPVHANLGAALERLGAHDDAEACYRRAIALQPDYRLAHLYLAFALLAAGRFEEGWREWEWRLPEPGSAPPPWRGEDFAGRPLVLRAEQGLGDTLQFCRFAPLLSGRGRIVLAVRAALVGLLRALPGVTVVAEDAASREALACPLLSLPHRLGTTLATVPARVPYLAPAADRVTSWRQRLSALPGRRVGLCWAGNPRHEADARRSIAAAQLAGLSGLRGVTFVSLQKDMAAPPPGLGIWHWPEAFDNFAETAALVAALDLVISVDSAVVHLAGALGQRVWLLNRFDSCWRWLRGRDDSPWYPTLRQFRQRRPGDWTEVLAFVRHALTEAAATTT